MSQNNISFDGSMTGASMLDERLTPLLNNLYSSNSGSTRPSYLQAGGTWFDSPNGKLMLFNGISEIPLSTLMTATETEAVTGSDDTKAMTPSGTTKVVGIGKYYVTRTYDEDDVVLNVDEGDIKLYQSLTDNNVGNDLTDETKWKIVKLGGGGGGGEIGDVGLAPFGIDETLNLRRYLNGQVISQSQFVSFTNKIKAIAALFPSLATTEVNWQAEKNLSKLGQCGKFVIDDDAGTIRLPCAVNIQSLTDLQYLGTIKSESLPNISGSLQLGDLNNAAAVSRNTVGAFGRGAAITSKYAAGGATSLDNFGFDFNASRSSSTYQDNAPVQQEAVQYPYYIQVATGIEETLPAIREYKVNNSDFFGKSMYSDVAPYNASWLVSNGQYNAKTIYPDYYDWLLAHIGETITTNGGKVVLSTDAITDYDWVVNTGDETFRLPLVAGRVLVAKKEATTEDQSWYNLYSDGWLEQGGVVANTGANRVATINLITPFQTIGYSVFIGYEKSPVMGLGDYGTLGSKTVNTFNVYQYNDVTLNWSACGYGEVPTSSEYTEIQGLYFYVGDTVQDASLINAGAVLGQLANCIDRTVASDRETVVGWGMPDWSAGVSVTLPYTANKKCFVVAYASVQNQSITFIINGTYVYTGGGTNALYYSRKGFYLDVGDVLSCDISSTGNMYPLKGVN